MLFRSATLCMPYLKLCVAPMSWFSAGFGLGYLCRLEKKEKEFDVIKYSKSCPSRKMRKLYDRIIPKRAVRKQTSARAFSLHKSYPMRLKNENTFKTREDAIIEDRWKKYNKCIKKYACTKPGSMIKTSHNCTHSCKQTCYK